MKGSDMTMSVRESVIEQIVALKELRRLHELCGAKLQELDVLLDNHLGDRAGAETSISLNAMLDERRALPALPRLRLGKKAKAKAKKVGKRKYTKKSKWWSKKKK